MLVAVDQYIRIQFKRRVFKSPAVPTSFFTWISRFSFGFLMTFPNDTQFEIILTKRLVLLSLEIRTYSVRCLLINQASK